MKKLIISLFAIMLAGTFLPNTLAADKGATAGKCCAVKAISNCPVAESCPLAGTEDCPMAKSRPVTAQKVEAVCPTLKNAVAPTGTCPIGQGKDAKLVKAKKKQNVQHKGAYYLARR